jgi:gamma-resorcylate decarboxylase
MQGKITLEDHFATTTTLDDSKVFGAHVWSALGPRLLDLQDQRLRLMDAAGIEVMIVSLNAPAIQAISDVKRAVEVAREANDVLAREVAKRPDRFVGVAALPMQDADRAATELERCVRTLGFKGALVNGFSQAGAPDSAIYYDLPQYRPFWAVVERLGVPFYLHPRSPLARDARLYAGHPWLLGAAWAFGNETAVHALRLMGSGLFDEHPGLQIVLGHLGEGLPFNMWRVDNCNAGTEKLIRPAAKRKIADYFRANFHVTTSGNFSSNALTATMAEIGADRVMFSVDWPYEQVELAAGWFDNAAISENDRVKIGRSNAVRLFKLGPR